MGTDRQGHTDTWTTGTHTVFTNTHGHTDRCQEHTRTRGCLWGQRNKRSLVARMQVNLAQVPFRTRGTRSPPQTHRDTRGVASESELNRFLEVPSAGSVTLGLFLDLFVPLRSQRSEWGNNSPGLAVAR